MDIYIMIYHDDLDDENTMMMMMMMIIQRESKSIYWRKKNLSKWIGIEWIKIIRLTVLSKIIKMDRNEKK